MLRVAHPDTSHCLDHHDRHPCSRAPLHLKTGSDENTERKREIGMNSPDEPRAKFGGICLSQYTNTNKKRIESDSKPRKNLCISHGMPQFGGVHIREEETNGEEYRATGSRYCTRIEWKIKQYNYINVNSDGGKRDK